MKPEDIKIQRVPYAGTPSDDILFIADARRASAHPERVRLEIADLRAHSVVLYEHYTTHGKILRSRSLALTGHGSMISLLDPAGTGKMWQRAEDRIKYLESLLDPKSWHGNVVTAAGFRVDIS